MGKPVGTRCVQKFDCKWLGLGQMTSFYALSNILCTILSGDEEICGVVFSIEWRIALEGLDGWICLELVCIDGLDFTVASADCVTLGKSFFLTASFVAFSSHKITS